MKIRKGFVTNSSSSSFLISKESFGEEPTVQSVYLTIKLMYEEYYEKVRGIKEDAISWGIISEGNDDELKDLIRLQIHDDPRAVNFSRHIKTNYNMDLFDIRTFEIEDEKKSWFLSEEYNPEKVSYPFEITDHRELVNDDFEGYNDYREAVNWYLYEDSEDNDGTEWRELTNEQAKLKLIEFGTIGVYSECGYINDSVVEKLGELSNRWCNHMG